MCVYLGVCVRFPRLLARLQILQVRWEGVMVSVDLCKALVNTPCVKGPHHPSLALSDYCEPKPDSASLQTSFCVAHSLKYITLFTFLCLGLHLHCGQSDTNHLKIMFGVSHCLLSLKKRCLLSCYFTIYVCSFVETKCCVQKHCGVGAWPAEPDF